MDDSAAHAIRELADCVVIRNPEKWLLHLTKWLVAVVANAMDDCACRNHTCLVLTGEQGRFKATFLDLLCPPELHGYSYTGKIYPQEKDTLTYVGQNFIINIDDQLKALNKRDENELKNLITCPMVKYRMPYGMGEALKRVGYIKVSRRRNGSSPLYVYKIRKILPCPLLQSCSSNM